MPLALIEVMLEVIQRSAQAGPLDVQSAYVAVAEIAHDTAWLRFTETLSNIFGNVFTVVTSGIVIWLTLIIASANNDTNKRNERERSENVKLERNEKLLGLSNYLIQNRDLFEDIEYPISEERLFHRCVVYFDFNPSHKNMPNEFISYGFAKVENINNPINKLSFRFIGHSQAEPTSIEIIEQPEFSLESTTWDDLFYALKNALNYEIRQKLSFESVELEKSDVEEISRQTRFSGRRRGHTSMNTKGDREVVDAILDINACRVTNLIDNVSHIDARDSSGRTFLHYAVSIAYIRLKSHYEQAITGDPEDIDREVYASKLMKDLNEIMSTLINKGANINARDNQGDPIMYAAADSGNYKAVDTLIQEGAIADLISEYSGSTALHAAVNSGSLAIVEKLINNGYNINHKNSTRKTPLHFALQLDKLNMTYWMGHPMEIEKLIENQSKIIEMLIENNAIVDKQDEEGWTPLHYATQLEQSTIIEMLIKGESDISSMLVMNHFRTTEMLIVQGANVNERNEVGRTPLHSALWLDQSSIVKALLKGDADEEDGIDQSEVVDTLVDSQLALARMLIEKGAQVNEKDKGERAPIHYAFQLIDKLEVAKTIDEAQFDIVDGVVLSNMLNVLAEGQLKVAKMLIESEANVNEKDKNGETPLHIASYVGYLPAIEILIKNGAEVNEINNSGKTPLEIVLKSTNSKAILPIASFYLRNGASISLWNRAFLVKTRIAQGFNWRFSG